MAKRIMFLTGYFLLPVLLIAAIFSSNPGYYGSSGFVPMVLGATAYTWLNAQLLLSARPKWAEKYFGLDRMYRFHSLMAVIAIALAFAHKLLKSSVFPETLQTKLGDLAVVIFLAAAVLALIFMADTLVNLIRPLGLVRDFFKKIQIGKYNIQVLLHNLNVLAVVLIFAHVMLTYSAGNPFVKSLYLLYFGAAAGFYLYHKVIRRYFLSKRFMIEKVVPESPSMTTLTLRPENDAVFSYLPGQFGFLRVLGGAVSPEEHPFSFSSQPLDRRHLAVTIKNLGDWTQNVQALKAGGRVLLDGPYGRFSPTLFDTSDGIVLIAGGVGITPMLSILRYYRQADPDRRIVLFWGVNTSEELICADEFQELRNEMKHFVFVPVAAREPGFAGEKGFLTRELMERTFARHGLDRQKLHFFFCGPAPMWPPVHGILNALGIRGRQIHRESFSL